MAETSADPMVFVLNAFNFAKMITRACANRLKAHALSVKAHAYRTLTAHAHRRLDIGTM